MTLSGDEWKLLVCMYKKHIIQSKHRRVDSIAALCQIRDKKGFKKTLRKLASQGYLIGHHDQAFSLNREYVALVEEYLSLR